MKSKHRKIGLEIQFTASSRKNNKFVEERQKIKIKKEGKQF